MKIKLIGFGLICFIFSFVLTIQNIKAEDKKTWSQPKKEEPVGFKLVGVLIKKSGEFNLRTESEDVRFPNEKSDYSSMQNKKVTVTGKGYISSGVKKSNSSNREVPYTHRFVSISDVKLFVEPEKPKKEEEKKKEDKKDEKPNDEKPADEKPAGEKPKEE